MYIWQQVPVFRAVMPFLIAIILAINLPLLPLWGLVVIFIIIFSLSFVLEKYVIVYPTRWIRGIYLTLLLFIAALCFTQSKVEINHPNHFSKLINGKTDCLAKVISNGEVKNRTIKFDVKIVAVNKDSVFYKCAGKAIVYLPKSDSLSDHIQSGDLVLIKATFKRVKPPVNPGQFNYSRFLYYKQFYHQAFVKPGQFEAIASSKYSLVDKTKHLKANIVLLLQDVIENKDEAAIASALLVGYKTELSNETRQSFASTGAMHVLAVSGLHVGIIFIVFSFLLRFIKRIKYGDWVFSIIIIGILWMYALLTGLSPSVSRAAVMFSFVAFGQNFRKNLNIFGSIITSLFVLLLNDPFLITQVGFQLSYAAVIGIVYLQPRINAWLHPPKVFKWLWDLSSVSVAAQMATFPLSLYYFNIFPIYFLVSNIVVIPAAMLIIYIGIAFLAFHYAGISLLAIWTGKGLAFIVHLLNQAVLLIQKLPYGLVEEVYLSGYMLMFIYGLVLCFIIFLIYKNKSMLVAMFASLFLIVSLHTVWQYKNHKLNRMVIYGVNKATLIGFYFNDSTVFYGDSNILGDYYKLKYNTFRDVWKHGRKSEEIVKIAIGDSFKSSCLKIAPQVLQFDTLLILIPQKGVIIDSLMPCHILLLQESPYGNPSYKNDLTVMRNKKLLSPAAITNLQKPSVDRLYKYSIEENGALVWEFR